MQTNIMDSNIVGDFKSNFFKSLNIKIKIQHTQKYKKQSHGIGV